MLYSFSEILYYKFCTDNRLLNSKHFNSLTGENMKQQNESKQTKKLKQIERKKKRSDKQKALLVFWNDEK